MTDKVYRRVVYINGLERANVSTPKAIIRRLQSHDILVTHMAVDWHSGLTFPDLLHHGIELTKKELRQYGRVALIGASAGGSLGVNLFQVLRRDDPCSDISLISLSSRLRIGDPKNLEEAALNSPNKKQSLAYIESVSKCEKEAVPNLLDEDKKLMRTVHPLFDQIVPLDTMGIDGVEDYTVPVSDHIRGIALGVFLVPSILDDIYTAI